MTGFELIEDVQDERKKIERTIEKHGSHPEHNFGYFLSRHVDPNQCVFIKNGEWGIQATRNRAARSWTMIGPPVAPRERQVEFLNQALAYLQAEGGFDRFVAEFETGGKKESEKVLNRNFRTRAPNCVLYWPVYDLEKWTGDELEGRQWKKMRNAINGFRKKHEVEIVDSKKVDGEDLRKIVRNWARRRNQSGTQVDRKDSNRTDCGHYVRMVDLNFMGCKFAKTVLVDGVPSTITAGWDIPNADREYYSGIGLHDLSVQSLGEFSNWSDLALLKKNGYRKADFGGSPKPLLLFKKKFYPEKTYRTYIFAIGRKT